MHLLRQFRAFVCCFSKNVVLLTHACLVPCCDLSIFRALVTFLIIINNQCIRNYTTLWLVIKSWKYANRLINQLPRLKP